MLAHHGSLYTLSALLISISFIMAGCGGQPDFIPAAAGMTLHLKGQVRTVEDGHVRLNLATGEVFVVEFTVEFIDSVVVKGKTEPVKIYKLREVKNKLQEFRFYGRFNPMRSTALSPKSGVINGQ